MKYQLATPLLMANILRWMAPGDVPPVGSAGGHRRHGERAGRKGHRIRPACTCSTRTSVRCPSPLKAIRLRFFCGRSGHGARAMGDRETVYSLTLPDVGEAVWQVRRRMCARESRAASAGRPRRDRSVAVAGGSGRNRAAGRLAALRPQPGVPIARACAATASSAFCGRRHVWRKAS